MSNINVNNVSPEIIARDLRALETGTDNIYESIAIMAKRANQLSKEQKEEIHGKMVEFNNSGDSLEEVFENREQMELSVSYERLPKTTLLATEEYLNNEIYFRNPAKTPSEI